MHLRHRSSLAAGLLLTAIVALPSGAQQGGAMMGPHGQAMRSAMQRMQQSMPMSGDPDVDFARMMILHHQGAIDMARSQLEQGQDPQLRQMAQKIIEDQEREIATLTEWLAQQQK